MWFGSDESHYDRRFDRYGDRYDDRYDDRFDHDEEWHDPDDYWFVSRQPLAVFLFIVPMIAAYELGAHYINTGSAEPVRNGADYWLRSGLARFGLSQPWLLPAVLLGGLAVWQVFGRYRWRVSAGTLVGMLAESLAYGMCLVLIGEAQEKIFREFEPVPVSTPQAAIALPDSVDLTQAISFLGAGIYEEVLFRAALLPLCFVLFRTVASRRVAICLAVVVSSLLFSGAHYVGAAGDNFNVFGFVFRAIAGAVFAIVMVLRGFGISVGTHAAYDILVGILLPANLLETWLSGGS
ncbi:MAG: CPBP family intramembrane metalloprotease [Planctomycetota bacterium]|nr:CPBP family intramembrane metalloprotease [Planctomycetota bacterium]